MALSNELIEVRNSFSPRRIIKVRVGNFCGYPHYPCRRLCTHTRTVTLKIDCCATLSDTDSITVPIVLSVIMREIISTDTLQLFFAHCCTIVTFLLDHLSGLQRSTNRVLHFSAYLCAKCTTFFQHSRHGHRLAYSCYSQFRMAWAVPSRQLLLRAPETWYTTLKPA